MGKLTGLNMSLCQMEVVPGRPDLNANYIVAEIESAKERGIDIIIFPEMCVTGYIVGDIFEDDFFVDDVLSWNKKIAEATKNGVAAIFGSITVSPVPKKGEDSRQRKHNAAIIAKDGKVLAVRPKTLQPNYRFFNDDKHFFSQRKLAQETNESLKKLLQPTLIKINEGDLRVGVIICEDMWYQDYAFNPSKVLVEQGAEIIVNISASPWTWQKNRKRHQVIAELLLECGVPFVYVNNTGVQNTGKNIIVFDGSSTVYNKNGEIIFEIQPYEKGTHDFKFSEDIKAITLAPRTDTEELYAAMTCATRAQLPAEKKVLIGLSGGIDSAVVCAHLADVFGKDRVLAINMPMPPFNSQSTQDMARTIAQNLEISYEVMPIDDIVEAICRATDVRPGSLAHENIQSRTRKEILAAKAQKIDGFFICCSNKTEMAFGYGTLYGDIAGFYAPLGDLVKREVRQIADYLNRVRFGREVIPLSCINQAPTAELSSDQKDPFDYGNLTKRGYHDEMIRAFTDFRKNPEWFLETYLTERLERELGLEKGTINSLFPTARQFVNDLRHWWIIFQRSFFKRVQCPPIPIFSKRAFGRDLEESLMQPYFTQRYRYLEKYLLSRERSSKQRITVFGGSFNPPAINHKVIIEKLSTVFDLVLVVPCGIRTDKLSTTVASPEQRKKMAIMTFEKIPKIELDFYDLDNGIFTPTHLLEKRYAKRFPDAEIWFAVGDDLVTGGRYGLSEIQKSWKNGKEIWRTLKFLIISQPGKRPDLADLPPIAEVLELETIFARSTNIREKVAKGNSIDGLVAPEVEQFIKDQKLYA